MLSRDEIEKSLLKKDYYNDYKERNYMPKYMARKAADVIYREFMQKEEARIERELAKIAIKKIKKVFENNLRVVHDQDDPVLHMFCRNSIAQLCKMYNIQKKDIGMKLLGLNVKKIRGFDYFVKEKNCKKRNGN